MSLTLFGLLADSAYAAKLQAVAQLMRRVQDYLDNPELPETGKNLLFRMSSLNRQCE